MFDDHGIMLTGWIQDNDTWYYADSNGRLEKGSISIDGKSYTFAENGAMLSGAMIKLQHHLKKITIKKHM